MSDRPVMIVDLDNVVYDWVGAMANWIARNTTIHIENRVKRFLDGYTHWEVWDDWGIPKGEFIRWWRLGIEAEEIYAKGPIISGARDALWRLSDAEWDIHIATSRLTKFGLHDKIVANTSLWLRENNIPYRQLSFTHQKTRIMADAIVDDRADNMRTPLPHKRAFLFPAPHNKGIGKGDYHLEFPENWNDIVEALT